MEKARANNSTERISPIDVLGMMVAGRRVSWATCEMDSSPTKEMIANDEPRAKLPRLAEWWVKFATTRFGSQTRLKPAMTITAWPTMAMTPRKLLNVDETLMPRTFIQINSRMPATVSRSQNQ